MSEPKYQAVEVTAEEEAAFLAASRAITAIAERFQEKNGKPLQVTVDFLERYELKRFKSRAYAMWCLKAGYGGLDGSGRGETFADAMFRLAGGQYQEEVLEAAKKYRERAAELEADAPNLPKKKRRVA